MARFKTMIIKRNIDLFFGEYDDIYRLLRVSNENVVYRFFKKFKLPVCMFFAKWKEKVNQYDRVVIFDNCYNKKITKYIKKKNPNVKIILWYWNPVIEYGDNLSSGDKYIDEVWTYNKFDAEKYGFYYNPQFYSNKIRIAGDRINDVLFVGRDKGRGNKLNELREELSQLGLKSQFFIIEKEANLMPYEDYLRRVGGSKCILDIAAFPHAGLSLRPMEALFLRRKLITDNLDIVNHDFYKPENIFVLGRDSLDGLKRFIESPYRDVDNEIIEYYDFKNWLKRFNKEGK